MIRTQDPPVFAQDIRCLTAASSLRGSHRSVNEDIIRDRFWRTAGGTPVGFAVICDGLGGLEAGEIAGRLAVQTVHRRIADLLPRPDQSEELVPLPARGWTIDFLRETVALVNERIFSLRRPEAGEAGLLGTAMTLVLLVGSQAFVAHIGNSRAYLFRDGCLTQLTHDHSYAAELMEAGIIPAGRLRTHRFRNTLTRALGTRPFVQADIRPLTLEPHDELFLCSNGLWSSFYRSDDMAGVLRESSAPPKQLADLFQAARLRDGRDDMSAILIRLEPAGEKGNPGSDG